VALILVMRKNEKELKLELKSKEAALSASHQRWDSLLNMLPQMVFEYESDDKAKIVFINEFGLKLLGYKDSGEVSGKSAFDFFDTSDKERLIEERQRVLRHKATSINEYICIKKNGKHFPVALYSAPVYDANKKLCGVRGVLVDLSEISQFRETIDKLKNLDKIKDDFLNIAAHELKTPLTTLLMMAEMLKMKSQQINSNDIGDQADLILQETKRLRRIVDQILTVTRFENGKHFKQNNSFDLVKAMNDFKPDLEFLVSSRNLKIEFDIPNKEAIVFAEKDRLLEVVYNFIDNALKYGGDTKVIKLNVFLSKKEVRVEVVDQGDGIEEAGLKNIFLKFSQLENPLQRRQEGIGLGLYICRLIIESYQGKIGVDSVLKKGSTFYFTLPIKE
jgi:PAS domain S-box-containing protein